MQFIHDRVEVHMRKIRNEVTKYDNDEEQTTMRWTAGLVVWDGIAHIVGT